MGVGEAACVGGLPTLYKQIIFDGLKENLQGSWGHGGGLAGEVDLQDMQEESAGGLGASTGVGRRACREIGLVGIEEVELGGVHLHVPIVVNYYVTLYTPLFKMFRCMCVEPMTV